MIKIKKNETGEECSCLHMEEMRSTYKILGGESVRKRAHGRPRYR
jgi:hypothetical protein